MCIYIYIYLHSDILIDKHIYITYVHVHVCSCRFPCIFQDISIIWFLPKRETPHKKNNLGPISEIVQQPSTPPRRNTEVLSAMNAFPENLVTLVAIIPIRDELGRFSFQKIHSKQQEQHWKMMVGETSFFFCWDGLNLFAGDESRVFLVSGGVHSHKWTTKALKTNTFVGRRRSGSFPFGAGQIFHWPAVYFWG